MAVALTRIQEFKVIQTILADVKCILNIDDDVLKDQGKYWIKLSSPVINTDQQERITVALKKHLHTPIEWLDSTELEVVIDPDCRIATK